MKYFFFAFLSSLSTIASAVKCGTAISKDCVADTDIRYDHSEGGYDLESISPFWDRLSGLYKGYANDYAGDPAAMVSRTFGYFNFTVVGSRVYQHRYIFEGEPDIILWDDYQVSTFEKDGSVRALGLNSNLPPAPFEVTGKDFTGVALDGNIPATEVASSRVSKVSITFVLKPTLAWSGTQRKSAPICSLSSTATRTLMVQRRIPPFFDSLEPTLLASARIPGSRSYRRKLLRPPWQDNWTP